MNIFNQTFLIRFALAIILIMHSVPGMFNGGVNAFGNLYLDKIGFAPFGLFLAWAIKITHVVCAVCLLWDKYILFPALATILVLVAGIVMIHGREGWFVVGGGRNGVEFNFLLIFALLMLIFPEGLRRKPKTT